MKYITLVLIILLASCDAINKERTIVKEDISSYNEPHIIYYHDCRTGLCFAEIITLNSHSHTYVPCDSVKQFLAVCD